MTIMVTGGFGLVGSNLVRYLAQQGESVVIYDTAVRGLGFLRGVEQAKVTTVIGDTLDLPRLIDAMCENAVEKVIHTAAPISNDIAALGRPYQTIRENIETVLNCVEAARLAKVRRFVHVGSGAVYGSGPEPATEESQLMPSGGAYGLSKAASDMVIQYYAAQYAHTTEYVIARIIFAYGPGRTEEATYVGALVASALNDHKIELEIGGDYRAEFTHVTDIAQGLYALAHSPLLKHSVYNIGAGRQFSIREVVDEIARQIPGIEVRVGPGLPEGRAIRRLLKHERIAEELGYSPHYDLAAGVSSMKRWLTTGDYE